MAGAQFMPSTMYGLDPVSLAGKVANTNAAIASTQATRQSMMERSQMMRLREEQANREREKYAREMPFQQEMMDAEHVKRQADIARAQAEVRDFTTKAQLESEFDQKALDAEVLQAKSYDNWQEQIDALDGVLRRNSRYSMIPAGQQFLSAVDKERNNLVVQRDKAMYAAVVRTRQNEALASGERKAQISADASMNIANAKMGTYDPEALNNKAMMLEQEAMDEEDPQVRQSLIMTAQQYRNKAIRVTQPQQKKDRGSAFAAWAKGAGSQTTTQPQAQPPAQSQPYDPSKLQINFK